MTATDPQNGGDEEPTAGSGPDDARPPAEYDEREPMREEPVVDTIKTVAIIQLRRWVIIGLGVLLAGTIIGVLGIVAVRPELAGFGAVFAHVVAGGLLALAFIAVLCLFGRAQ